MENAFGGTDKQREGRQASRRDRPHGRTDTRATSWRQKGCITDRDCLSQPAQQGRNLGARHSGKGTYDETMLALAGPRGLWDRPSCATGRLRRRSVYAGQMIKPPDGPARDEAEATDRRAGTE
jgi:hypothetical protein